MDELILTVDLGTSGPKVALFDTKAKLIGSAFEEIPLLLFENGGAEQRPADWIAAIKSCYSRLIYETKANPKHIIAMNCTSQWSGTVAVDRQGNPLMNSIIWMDSRGAASLKKLNSSLLNVDGYDLFKILKWLKITGGAPSKAGKDSLAHILYLKDALPEIYAQTYKFLEPKDYLNLYFSGQFLSSYDAITLHWVTDNRDINKIDYHPGLIKMVGLDREKLPDLVPTNSIVGKIRKEIAQEFGLNEDVQLISGAGDVHSAAVGSGAVNDYEGHLYIGTSSWIVCHTPVRKTDVVHNIGTIPSGIPGKYMVANEQQTMGACLQFLRNNIFYPKDALNPAPPPENFYAVADQLVDSVAPGAGGLIFMPWLYGERSPYDDSTVRGGFMNLTLAHTRAHLFRSVFEGVALNSRWLFQYVEKLAGRKFEHINFIGGGAKSATWCQIFADIYDRPIHAMKDPILCNSRGTAILALLALGKTDLASIGKLVEVQKVFDPRAEYRSLYDERFARFVETYKNNKSFFAKMNAVKK
jgi:xylulokinase